ncbi:retrotransposon gag family protein, partial [Candidatus Burkholderia verschuerenii]|uniref:retrotransposon gag family protein n=1 Tax=Candidatus Burkholderia verschuerenii TaxID=242163 RepID=UPI000A6D8AD5
MAEMMEFIKRQESQIARLGETIEEMRQGGEQRETGIVSNGRALKEFLKFHPPTFRGIGNEEDAELWLEKIVKIYAPLHYSEERKIQFAAFLLEGSAEAWWRVTEQKWVQTAVQRSWQAFRTEFEAKYIPKVVREKRGEEFLHFKQNNLTVSQYEGNFTRLSKYAPELVNTEEKRRWRFVQGLKIEIQNAMLPATVSTYAGAVDLAQRLEDGQAGLRDLQNSRRIASCSVTATGEEGSQEQGTEPPRGTRGVKCPAAEGIGSLENRETSSVRCRYCDKTNHVEADCWKKNGRCLRCGS